MRLFLLCLTFSGLALLAWTQETAARAIKTSSVTVYKFTEDKDPSDNSVVSKRVLETKSSVQYDEAGRKTEWAKYGPEGGIIWRWSYKYNDKGNKIESRFFGPDNKLSLFYTYEYNAAGLLTERILHYQDGRSKSYAIYKYDGQNRLSEIARFDDKDKSRSRTILNYDKDGNLTDNALYDARKKLKSKWHYSYNMDRTVDWVIYIEEEKLLFQRFYTYDAKGNLTEIASQDIKGNPIGKRTLKYDQKNRLTDWVWLNVNNRGEERYQTRYDAGREYPTDRLKYVTKKISGEAQEILETQEVYERTYEP